MAKAVLVGSGTSPFVRKVRVALAEKQIAYEFKIDPPWSPTATVTEHNPLGKIPVFIRHNEAPVYDSRVINALLDVIAPTPALYPAEASARIAVMRTEAVADGIMETVIGSVQETWRKPEARSPFLRERFDARLALVLKTLEQQTGQLAGRESLRRLDAGSIAIACALGLFDFWFPQMQWQASHPALAAIYNEHMQRTSFVDTVPRMLPGVVFPQL